jgi:D-glycero-D-manno-heptose 1,7-bisphosphate phosphatase
MKSKALFLDRDGVINVEQGYVHCRENFLFQKGIFALCRAAQIRRYLMVIVTNQAGIARGYYTEAEFLALTEWMVQRFAEQGIQIARVYFCPYHPLHGVGAYKYDSPDRKPMPGMLLRAKTDLSLDLTASVLVGDKLSDILAAEAAGIGTKILLRSGATEVDVQPRQCHVAGSLDEIRSRFFSTAL